ncbi:ribonuclease 1 [Artemisia annua]|uniref:Ribonuclease 1 n=1 Tax=Artemisia annua TaxID=35608 RepID=A0A2U1KW41_ARTAN|nr:ribonuclease 1 [Artemisia annua]
MNIQSKNGLLLIKLLTLNSLLVLCASQDFDFFYFVQQQCTNWLLESCKTTLDQHGYFSTALNLETEIDILKALQNAGIQPNGQTYSLSSIKDAIKGASGYNPWIQCNKDESGNSQLYQIYLCVDSSASAFIECPVFPHGSCGSSIEFPSF